MTENTIEQMKALKEGTTPGPWVITPYQNPVGIQATRWHDIPMEIANARLAAAAPDLVDALIAEKQAHAKLREEVEAMREDWERAAERSASARDSHEHPAKAAYARHLKSHQIVIRRLTRILGADNG